MPNPSTEPQDRTELPRRRAVSHAVFLLFGGIQATSLHATPEHPNRRWFLAAEAMRQLALSWGDQSYGAVLVTTGGLVAEGPSRVVKNSDPTAHAEREAIREAQRRLGTPTLRGSVLYSTSRPCRACEQAAADAGVSRMYFGPYLVDGGAPQP